MTGQLFTADHHVYDLPPLLDWNVTLTGSVPCDCFSVSFLYDKKMLPVLEMASGFVAMDGADLVLHAIVDEYCVELGSQGLVASVTGRGYAARLLDNESRPVTYQEATLDEIIRQHVAPYGVSCKASAHLRAGDVYTVAAGTSQWKALENFCLTYGHFSPRFERDGTLIAAPESSGKVLQINDSSPILSCTLREDHYGVLSEALIIDKTRNASYSVTNPELLRKGGRCRRVVYTPGQSTWAAMRYTGEYQIEQSKADEWSAELTLPGNFLAFPGDRVQLSLSRMGLSGTFRVAEAENRFSIHKGAVVSLTLKKI